MIILIVSISLSHLGILLPCHPIHQWSIINLTMPPFILLLLLIRKAVPIDYY